MSNLPFTLEEELSLRTHSAEVWEETWSRAGSIDSKKAFIEGHFMGMAMGVLALRATHKVYAQRLAVNVWWMFFALTLGIVVGQVLPRVFYARF